MPIIINLKSNATENYLSTLKSAIIAENKN